MSPPVNVSNRLILLVFLVPTFAYADDEYQFTFTNPSWGSTDAPYLLQYFSRVDCEPCRDFELTHMASLRPLVAAGTLRVVFRDLLPESDLLPQAKLQFCLQETSDYVTSRLALKSDAVHSLELSHDNELSIARYQACLSSPLFSQVMRFNGEVFQKYGMVGTPAFTFTLLEEDADTLIAGAGTAFFETVSSLLPAIHSRKDP